MGAKTSKDTYCVYVHIFPNGKRYYGQTCVDPQVRWRHGRRYSGLMRKAIEKYGWDNIEHSVLITGLTLEQANAFEISLIEQYQTTDPEHGYNITKGGDGYSGAKHSEKTKRILREKAIKQWQRQKAEGYTPPKMTEEQLTNLSKSHLGQKAWNKGLHTMTDEMKAKLKKGREGYWKRKAQQGESNEQAD